MPAPPLDTGLIARCGAIELLVLDVDGVLTDGTIAIDDRGIETKLFHVRDGTGITLWRKAGKRAAILSSRSAQAVNHRAAELGIERVIQGVREKLGPFRALIGELGMNAHQVCYVGDDLADRAVLAAAGLAVCPADAAPEIREIAQFITRAAGGRGAVREVVEIILKYQGVWNEVLERAYP